MLINCPTAADETAGRHDSLPFINVGGTQLVVKIYLTVAGDVSDVIDTIRRLAAGNGFSSATASNNPNRDPGGDQWVNPPVQPPVGHNATVAQYPWTEELARALWQLLTPDVQEVYRRVAHGDGHALARESLLDDMGFTARSLSGRLSSQGHAMRRIRRRHNVDLPHPMAFDPSSEQYRMRPDLAGVIVELNL